MVSSGIDGQEVVSSNLDQILDGSYFTYISYKMYCSLKTQKRGREVSIMFLDVGKYKNVLQFWFHLAQHFLNKKINKTTA